MRSSLVRPMCPTSEASRTVLRSWKLVVSLPAQLLVVRRQSISTARPSVSLTMVCSPLRLLGAAFTDKTVAAPLIKRNTTTVLDTDHEGTLDGTTAISDETVSLPRRLTAPNIKQAENPLCVKSYSLTILNSTCSTKPPVPSSTPRERWDRSTSLASTCAPTWLTTKRVFLSPLTSSSSTYRPASLWPESGQMSGTRMQLVSTQAFSRRAMAITMTLPT